MQKLPEAFVKQMKGLLGEAGFFDYEKALEEPVQRALRINLLRFPDGVPPCQIEGLGESVPWAKGAYFVEGGARPGLDPLHEGGLFYLQEPSALTAVTALDPQPGERILDLCAAPGGKSTQIAALMGGQGILVCNEPNGSRVQILSRNIERMGVRNAIVVSAMPDELAPRFPGWFDRVLVDAPCSGEGMFRRQPEAREEWQENTPAGCAERQMEILEQACRMLRPGGRMVYSTCTFNNTENEGVLARFLKMHPEFHMIPLHLEGLQDAPDGYMHLYPHRMRGEGHFVSLLEKNEDAPVEKWIPKGNKAVRGSKAREEEKPDLPDVLAEGMRLQNVRVSGDVLWSWPDGIEPERLSGMKTLRTGLQLARKEGRHTEPDHALAMALRPGEASRCAEVTKEQALLYQAGEVLDLGDLPSGFTLLTCEGVPLGWGKQAGGTMKNHYPKGLRRRGQSIFE